MGSRSDDDDRYIVVDGRRWRATDPAIPGPFRQELVKALMAGRREVGAAGRAGDSAGQAAARTRVQDAKVALGERGEPWWEVPSPQGRRTRLTAAVMTLLRARDATSSICPSDVARAVGGPAWRDEVPLVRELVDGLAAAGLVEVTQGGRAAAGGAAGAKGPVRIRRGGRFS